MPAGLIDPYALPGMGTPVETTDREPFAGPGWAKVMKGIVLVSTAVDAGNTPTTLLRNGLLLGKVTSSGKYKEYNPAGTDGSQICRGYLEDPVNMLDTGGTAADKAGRMVVWAFDVKATELLLLDAKARRQLNGRIFFDDGWVDASNYVHDVIAKTADYTVLAADNNTLFTTRGAVGAVNFTLPTLARGLRFRFFNEAGQNMTVTSVVADTLVAFNDLAADSIAFSTANELIGGSIEVIANDDASKWLVFVNLGAETQTPTIAT